MGSSLYSPKAAERTGDEAVSGGFAGITVDSVDGAIPAGGVGAAAGGWDTAGNRDTAITTLTEVKATVNEIITKLGITAN